VRFDPLQIHPWVRGRWLCGGEVWVPAILAFLSLNLGPENLFCQRTSNGLAASTDPDEASLRATLELVERDAFMAAWLTGTRGRRVAIDGRLRPELRAVLADVEELGASVELYLLPTSTCGATAMCLALGDGERWPGATLGLGADLTPAGAVRRAILELGQTGPHLRRLMRAGELDAPAAPEAVREMLDHAAFYFPSERASAFDRLRSDGGDEAPDEPTPRGGPALERCARELESAGVRVALVDVTAADVATGPFRVACAISPDLQDISHGHGLDRVPVERLRGRALAAEPPPVHPIW
jgi:ribosomal protein S12 methylthiotransferase accessory factor